MILSKVVIHKYKSFITEQTYTIEKSITRIVGKNESGKTALLESLAKSNYFEESKEFKFNKDLDYPRNGLTKVKNENPAVITCYYTLSEEDLKEIESTYKSGIISELEISVTSFYDNTQKANICIDFNLFKASMIASFDVGDQGKEIINSSSDFNSFVNAVEDNLSIPGIEDIKEKIDNIKKVISNSECNNILEEYFFITYFKKHMPKFWYFSDYFSLPYRIDIKDFISSAPSTLNDEEIRIVRALFELSGLQPEDIQSETNFESFKAQLEATSNSITDDMFEYWTTNQNLEIRFEIEHVGNSRFLNIRIYNSKHRVTLPLKNRSKGFLWFFSFLVWFSKIQGDNKSKYILLLDEPGLSLHASAQNDLLRFIDEKLAPNYQVVYTTHSPFMIDSLKLNEVRTVYDTQDSKIGSVVSDAVEEKDSDTLFPLQAALGYTIAQNLYVSPKNLLVEGISDLVYLNHFSTILKGNGKEGLSDDVTIVPVGGADKIATFISLMRGNELNTVCLLDSFTDQKAQANLDKMIKQKIIKERKILYYHNAIENDYADIEDMFTKDEYIALYNGAFNQTISLTSLDNEKPILQQLKRLNDNRTFNHYAPANYMAKNIGSLNFSDETIDRFEKLFKIINSAF